MGKINMGRVLLGGLVAGVVLNIGEFLLNEVVLKEAMKQDLTKLNLAEPGSVFFIRAVGMTFILGIILVYLYAAVRSRFGPGTGTAVCAGLFGWSFVYLYAGYIYFALGMMSTRTFMAGLLWGAAEYALATVAGAWLYREE